MSRTALFSPRPRHAALESLEPRRLLSVSGGEGNPGDPPPDAGDSYDPIITTTSLAGPVVGTPVLRGSTIVFQGHATNETVAVTFEAGGVGGRIAVTVNGTKTTFDARQVRKMDLRLGAGNDTFTVNLPSSLGRMLIYAYAEDGNDTMTTNFPASLDGGNGDDTLNGSAGGDRLIGGPGNDTLRSNGGSDILRASPGRDRIIYANGDVDVGFLKLRTDRAGKLTIFGTRGNDRFVFSREGTTGAIVKVALGDDFATFDMSKVTALRVDGGAGRDEIVQQTPGILTPAGLLGNKPFSKKSIEVG